MRPFLSILAFALLLAPMQGHSQVLHTESFSAILDTSKAIKGSFLPSFRYRNVKQEFFEIENSADLSLLLGRNLFSLANKLEYARFGQEDIMSGGHLYLEYQRLGQDSRWSVEPYAMRLWQEIRGLELKYSLGSNLRYALVRKPSFGFFLGLGLLYEWEKWNYEGSPNPEDIPANPQAVYSEMIRWASYFSLKKTFDDLIQLDLSGYFQPSFNLQSYRMALSASMSYKFTSHIGLTLRYQNIYDPQPLVPIPELFNDLTLGLELSF